MEIFGIEFKRKSSKATKELKSFATPDTDDGSHLTNELALGGFYDQAAVDWSHAPRNDARLITYYRNMGLQPECELAIDDIINESIVYSDVDKIVNIVLDELEESDKVKNIIQEEFNYI